MLINAEEDLIDVWGEFNPDTATFTWRGPNNKQDLQIVITDADINASYKSDYSLVNFHLIKN